MYLHRLMALSGEGRTAVSAACFRRRTPPPADIASHATPPHRRSLFLRLGTRRLGRHHAASSVGAVSPRQALLRSAR